mmetsp:Transcript_8436/g.21568  ORF Transcript_8436/g.21568 Transcript_8436/m.21568 type:complete len:122 (-) Transcript_8436:893-1258(-)
MDTEIAPAEIVLADEVRAAPAEYNGRCVRVVGKVTAVHPRQNTAELGCGAVVVDLSLVGPVKTGSLYHFVGDVASGATAGAVVMARLGRCVDGLDLALYREALRVRRRFLASLAHEDTPPK